MLSLQLIVNCLHYNQMILDFKKAPFKTFLVLLFLISYSTFSQKVVPHSIRIKIKPEYVKTIKDHRNSKSQKGFSEVGLSKIDLLNDKHQVIKYTPVFAEGGKFKERREKFGLHLWYEIEFSDGNEKLIESRIADFTSIDEILIAEPIYEKKFIDGSEGAEPITINSTTRASIDPLFTTNDPRFNDQWHYHNTGQTGGTVDADIDLVEAWNTTTGSTDVIVAIIDGGIDVDHEDLSGNIWVNEAEFNGMPGVDDDGNGFIDDINGYNFAESTGPISAHNHGTHVAGTVAAVSNNGIGVAGVAGGSGSGDGVRLMSVQVFSNIGYGGFAESFAYAADNGAVISQNSWGYTSAGFYEQSVLDGIDYFIANAGYDDGGNPIGPMQGGIVIFAAGNDNSNGQHYPGYYSPTLAVASTNHNDQKSWYSNYGSWVDISAPGGETSVTSQGVLSTLPNDTYGYYQGTSMACPHASGVAALIVSEFGGIGFTPIQLRARMVETADNIDGLNSSYTGQLGSGRINAASSLLTDEGIAPDPIYDLATDYVYYNEVSLSWTAPEDTDNGSAATNEIRYSTSLITESNFASANLAGITSASSSGIEDEFVFSQLNAETTYYMAVRTMDYFGNMSSISNVVSFTTPAPPEIDVTPLTLTSDLFTGESEVKTITITNNGSSDLTFSVSNTSLASTTTTSSMEYVELPKGQLNTVAGAPVLHGFGDDGTEAGYSWVDSNEPGGPTFDWIDISSTGTPLSLYDDNYATISLPFDFEYYGEIKSQLHVSSNGFITFNTASASTYSYSPLPNTNNPNDLIALMWTDLNPGAAGDVYYLQETNRVIIQYNNVPLFGGGGSYTFEVIINENGEILIQYLSLSSTISYYSAGIENADGTIGMQFGYNTTYLENNLAVLISNEERPELTISPSAGVLASGESVDVDIEIDATGLEGGAYNELIVVSSNDPVNSTIEVELTVNVTGAPDLVVNRTLVDFEEQFVSYALKDSILIQNLGTDVLEISDISNSLTEFQISMDNMSIEPDDQAYLIIEFTPSSAISFTDVIEVSSNDAAEPIVSITVEGSGVNPPIISVDPVSLVSDLFTGETETQQVLIENNGEYDLIVSAGVNYITTTSLNKNPIHTKSIELTVSNPDTEENKDIIYSKNAIGDLDLTGKNVAFFGISDYSILIDFVTTQGGSYQSLSFPLSDLSDIDLIVINDAIYSASSSDLNLIIDFIETGGKLILEADNQSSATNINTIASKASVDFTGFSSFITETITDLEVHPITEGITSFNSSSYGGYYSGGEEIVRDNSGRGHIVTAEYGTGTILFLANELLIDYQLSSTSENELLGQQIIEWIIGENGNSWLSIDSNQFVIPGGSSEILNVTFDAFGLYGGTYEANLVLENNDPINSEVTIPITLNVTGAPDIDLEVGNVNFEEVFIGGTSLDSVLISNVGTDNLIISSISNSLSEFNVWANVMELAPEESTYLYVEFSPTSVISYSDLVEINSNDNDEGIVNIAVEGIGIEPPVIEVDPLSITADLFTGEEDIQIVTITNSGSADLIFSSSVQNQSISLSTLKMTNSISTTGYNNSNELVSSDIKGTYPYAVGDFTDLQSSPVNLTCFAIDPTTGLMYGQQEGGYAYYVYNPSTDDWSALSSSPVYPSNNGGATYSNGKIYTSYTSNSTIGVYDITNDTWSTISGSSVSTGNITSDNNYLYLIAGSTFRRYDIVAGTWVTLNSPTTYISRWGGIKIYEGDIYVHSGDGSNDFLKYNILGETWETLPSLPSGAVLGSALDTNDGVYYAYGSYGGANLYAYDIASGSWSVSTFSSFSVYDGGLVYSSKPGESGLYLIQGERGTGFLKMELDAVSSWISIDVYEGTVSSTFSTDINVTFNAFGLYGGTYEADLVIDNNDPLTPQVIVPITLNVTGAPDIDMDLEGLNFEEVFIGGSSIDSVLISNVGTDNLIISSITNSVSEFNAWADVLELAPEETTYLYIEFSPTSVLSYTDVIVINSNDVDESVLNISAEGSGIEPPIIEVDPLFVVSDLLTGEEENQIVTVTNSGSADLIFASSVQNQSISLSTLKMTNSLSTTGYNNSNKLVSSDIEGTYPFAVGDFTDLQSSPVRITCFAIDPTTGLMYGQQDRGYSYYVYDPSMDNWSALSSSPIYSSNNGGAAYLNGKIYTSYTSNSTIGVYDIGTDSWSTISGSSLTTGNITSDNNYLYLIADYTFRRYDISSGTWTTLNSPTTYINNWGGIEIYEGNIYTHSGDGTTDFLKYNILGDSWEVLPSLPSGAVLGSAIDTNDGVYYAYGSYGGTNLYAYDIASGSWSVSTFSSFSVNDGGIAYSNKQGESGLYLIQGESGTGFLKMELASAASWVSIDVSEGTVSPTFSMDINLTLNAFGLYGGTYEADLIIDNNDPLAPQVVVPITLNVTGAPDIAASISEIIYNDLYVGQTATDSVLIRNVGTEVLEIIEISTDNALFTPTFDKTSLQPFEESYLYVEYVPVEGGDFSGIISIQTNDHDEEFTIVNVSGLAIEPSVLNLSDIAISQEMDYDETTITTISITNEGKADLVYSFPDFNSRNVNTNYQAESLKLKKGEKDPRPSQPVNYSAGEDGTFGYSWIDSNEITGPEYIWNDISSTGTPISLSDDNGYLLSLDFDFSYYDEIKSSVYISSNGFLTFDASDPGSLSVNSFPNNDYPNDIIAAYWTDLNPANGGQVYFEMTNDMLVVQYNEVPFFGNSGSSNTFQIILYKNGNIRFNYNNLTSGYYTAVGIENSLGDDGMTISFGDSYLENGLSILIRNNESFVTSISPSYGTIAPGMSQSIDIEFSSVGMESGIYNEQILLSTNDPFALESIIEAEMIVGMMGQPQVDDSNISFGSLKINDSKSETVTLTNVGEGELKILDVYMSGIVFNHNLIPGTTLDVNESVEITLTFDPIEIGDFSSYLQISTDALNGGEVTLYMDGTSYCESPELIQDLGPIKLVDDVEEFSVDLRDYFIDPNSLTLSFTKISSPTYVYDATIQSNILTIKPKNVGAGTLRLKVSNAECNDIEHAIGIEVIDITTSLEGEVEAENLNTILFPNPAINTVSISLGNMYMAEDYVEISVIDQVGKIIQRLETPCDHTLKTIDISKFKAGSYFVKIKSNSNSEYFRLVKQ